MRRCFGSAAAPTLAGLAFACLALAWTAPASAFTLYTDRAAWEAALAGHSITTETFDDDIPGADTITFDSGVESTGEPNAADGTNAVSAGTYVANIDSGGTFETVYDSVTWTFPVAMVAFGVDWIEAASADGLMLIGDFDGTGNQVVSLFDELGSDGTGFLGIIGLSPFGSVLLTTEDRSDIAGENFEADNLSFAAAATAVPEPATLALLGAGLAGLRLLRRRRQT